MHNVATRRPPAEAWLRGFAEAVRERDYVGARTMCHENVTGFGTVSSRYQGIDELHQEQWHNVWDRTEGFDFDLGTATIWADGALVVAISEWSSVGLDGDDDDGRRARHGRATIVLTGSDDDLKAVHTHFSMSPGFLA